ncbi:MAG: hypothetical protein AB1567_09160 [bacterium]
MDFIKGIGIGIISALIVSLITIIVSPIGRKLKEFWKYYIELKKMGLNRFLSLEQFTLLGIFEKMIDEGKGGDEK